MANPNTTSQTTSTTPIHHHSDEPSITIWQSHLMICDAARQPACAAAILDLFERHSMAMIDQNGSGGWVRLSYEDIYFELFETFWLNNIKHHMRWLIERGFLQLDDEIGEEEEFGTFTYRFDNNAVARAVTQIGNNFA